MDTFTHIIPHLNNVFLFQCDVPCHEIAMIARGKLFIDQWCTHLYRLLRYIGKSRFNAVFIYIDRLVHHTTNVPAFLFVKHIFGDRNLWFGFASLRVIYHSSLDFPVRKLPYYHQRSCFIC